MKRATPKQRCNVACKVLLFCYFTLCCFIPPTFADAVADNSTDTEKLATLRQKIDQLQQELTLENQQKDKAFHQLQTIEKKIAESGSRLRLVNIKLDSAQRKLTALNREEAELKRQLSSNHDFLVKQIQASYAIGKQEYIKLLLNQQNPSSVARMVVYYRYFNESRARRLGEIGQSIDNLDKVSKAIRRRSRELSQLRQQAIADKQLLESGRNQRQQVVARLSARLQQKDNALQALLRDEQHLKRLLNQIETQIDGTLSEIPAPLTFAELKGKLRWPTKGTITARFGSLRKNTGNIRWKGALIHTRPGEAIHAVAHGRVVFADWLRGFGMLLIVDHGKGYMSLYGHNEQLHKKLGDWVQANEIIATSGSSGGQNTTSLYFEIRHNGAPQDPAKWCKSSPELS